MKTKTLRFEIPEDIYRACLNIAAQSKSTFDALASECLSRFVEEYQPELQAKPATIADWISQQLWTHTVHLTPNGEAYGGWSAPRLDGGYRLRKTVEEFHWRLSEDLYGRRRRKRLIPASLFFENRTRRGDPVYWHAHGVIAVADDYNNECLLQKADWLWRKLTAGRGSVRVEPINEARGGVANAVDYAGKHDGDVEPLYLGWPTT